MLHKEIESKVQSILDKNGCVNIVKWHIFGYVKEDAKIHSIKEWRKFNEKGFEIRKERLLTGSYC